MKATRICAALLVILLTLGMSGCLISPKEYAVSGVVTDKDTGLGVEGVTITFSGGFTPVTTDAEGRWTKTGVRGIVTVIPVATTNKFVPSSRVATDNASDVGFEARPLVETVFWYCHQDGDSHFLGLSNPISPTAYWDYEAEGVLTWVTPAIGTETGTGGNARVYHSLDGATTDSGFTFTRRNDLLEAYSTADADDIIIYEIDGNGKHWWWVHVGPYMSPDYVDDELNEYVAPRVSETICYALDVINGFPAELSAPPAGSSAAGTSALSGASNNR